MPMPGQALSAAALKAKAEEAMKNAAMSNMAPLGRVGAGNRSAADALREKLGGKMKGTINSPKP